MNRYPSTAIRTFLFSLLPALFLLCLGSAAMCQQPNINLQLLSQVNDYPQDKYSDVWGYVDPSGREYGIIGTRAGTAIYDLDDPTNPQIVAFINGANSIWRDIKDHQEYLYVIADQGTDGLLVIDMSQAPNNITHSFYRPIIELDGLQRQLTDCHNLYIDENGFLYLSGCSISNGVMIFDLNQSATEPPYVGRTPTNYSHDVFVRGDTLWSSDFNDGLFSVVDVRNKNAPTLLATQPTGFQGTHNAWLSDDGQYLFTTDERPNAFVEAYDVADLNNIQRVDRYRPLATEGLGVFPHNTHYYQGFLVTSYYTDGLKIIDAHRPHNLIEVGSYDTFDGPDGGTDGCWGAFPYFPSGLVLASDIQTGLYVFRPNYQKACYLEGRIISIADGTPLSDVEVQILSEQPARARSEADGQYATGLISPGTYRVAFSRSGFFPDTLSVNLQRGEVTIQNVVLRPIITHTVTWTARSADDQPVPGAQFLLENEAAQYSLTADETGSVTASDIQAGTYTVYAGAWGFQERALPDFILNTDRSDTVILTPGYRDHFNLDQGWTSQGTAASGQWERDIPEGTFFNGNAINPPFDAPDDPGNRCYVTGNGGRSAGVRDVDDGRVILQSPPLDLSIYQNPVLTISWWFVNTGGDRPPNDTLRLQLASAEDQTDLLVATADQARSAWQHLSNLPLNGTIDLSQPVRLIVTASDLPPNGHLVEAAIDAFSVRDEVATSVRPALPFRANLRIWPNPSRQQVQVAFTLPNASQPATLEIFSVHGQRVKLQQVAAGQATLALDPSLPAGTYFLRLRQSGQTSQTHKWIKLPER